MKKTLAAIAVVAMVFIASSAMAAGAKVPKLLCLDFGTFIDTHQLAFKASGTILDGTVKVKTYTITGADFRGPITGSGYILPGTTTLRAVYESTNTINAPQQSLTYKLVFDLETATGTIDILVVNSTGALSKQSDSVTILDCDIAVGPSEEAAAAGAIGQIN